MISLPSLASSFFLHVGGGDLGFDRLMSILCKTQSIRDVIAFPKTSGGTDLMFKSPAPVDAQTLKQYGIQSVLEGMPKEQKAKKSSLPPAL